MRRDSFPTSSGNALPTFREFISVATGNSNEELFMDAFHTEKNHDESPGPVRISRKQTIFGFDLFNDSEKDAQDVSFLAVPLTRLAPSEWNVASFPCFAAKDDEAEGNALFENGKSLSEFRDDFLKKYGYSETTPPLALTPAELQPLLDVFASVWRLLRQLEECDFSLKTFSPAEIFCSERENVWKALPTRNVQRKFRPSSDSPTRLIPSQRLFLNWLKTLAIVWPATIDSLQKWGETDSPNTSLLSQELNHPAIWSAQTPDEPFASLKTERLKDQQTIRWSAPANASGSLHLFQLKPTASFPPSFPLLPRDLLSEFIECEIPIQADSASFSLTDDRLLRLVGARSCGKWVKVGRVFRVGGPEDVTIFNSFWDEESLVLDLDWPDSIQRAKIVVSANKFPSSPTVRDSAGVRSWWFDRTNPLTPKRIPKILISDWKTVYVQIFGFTDSGGKRVFSIGLNPKSRKKIPRED